MRFVKIVMGEELNLMNNIERIIEEFVELDPVLKDIAKAIEQYIIKARMERLG